MRKADLDRMGELLVDVMAKTDINASIKAFNQTIATGHKPSVDTLARLLELSVQKRSLHGAKAVFSCLEFMGLEPTTEIYTLMMNLYAFLGDIGKVTSLFNEVQAKNLDLNISVYNAGIKALLFSIETNQLETYYNQLLEMNLSVNEETFSILMFAHAWKGDINGVLSWYNAMQRKAEFSSRNLPKFAIKPTSVSHQVLIYAYCQAKQVKQAWECLRIFQAQGTLSRKMYEVMIHHYTIVKNPSMCAKLFREMQQHGIQPNQNVYEQVVGAFYMYNYIDEGDQWLQEMESVGYTPTPNLLKTMIRMHLKKKEGKIALELFNHIIDSGLKPEQGTIIDLLCYLSTYPFIDTAMIETEKNVDIMEIDGHIDYIWSLFQPFRSAKSPKPTRMYHSILEYYVAQKSLDKASSIFRAILEDNLLPRFETSYWFSNLYVDEYGYSNFLNLFNTKEPEKPAKRETPLALKLVTEFGILGSNDNFEKTVPDLVDHFRRKKAIDSRILEIQIAQFIRLYKSSGAVWATLVDSTSRKNRHLNFNYEFGSRENITQCWQILESNPDTINPSDLAAFKNVIIKYCSLHGLAKPNHPVEKLQERGYDYT